MADGAVGRKACRGVTRVGCSLEIRLVTADARGGREREIVVHVTGSAGHRNVSARQRKSRRAVIEVCLKPGIHSVAGLAIRGKPAGDVIWVRGTLEIARVTGIALRR